MNINYKELHKLSLCDLILIRQWCLASNTLEKDYAQSVVFSCNSEIFKKMTVIWQLPTDKQWQYRTKQEIAWKNCTDNEYEQMHHLSRFEFQQIDV